MRFWFRRIFEIIWKAAVGLLAVGYDNLSEQELADAETAQARRIAQVSAAPADRDLARALITSREFPPGLVEVSRSWRLLDRSSAEIASVQQLLVGRRSRLRRRPADRMLLTLSRYRSTAEASRFVEAQPERRMSQGDKPRYRPPTLGDEIRSYEWTIHQSGVAKERVIELRFQRENAIATLLAQTSRPHTEWESEIRDLMRVVGGRLR